MRLKIAALLGVAVLAFSAATVKADMVCYEITGDQFVLGPDEPKDFWYKKNVGGQEETGLDPVPDPSPLDLFETTFGEDPNDPKDWAMLSWEDGFTPAIGNVLLKVGPEYYWADLSGVDLSAYNCIKAFSPTPEGRAISHITITGDPGTNVPDGGLTAMLLGVALSGLGATRRLIRK